MRRLGERLGVLLAGALLGAAIACLVGGGALFGRPLVEDLLASGASGPLVAARGARVVAVTLRLFALPGAAGGAAAALFAFRARRAPFARREPALAGPALVGLLVALLAAPVGLGLHVAALLGPDATGDAFASARGLGTEVLVSAAVAGLLSGVILGRIAAWRARPRRLRWTRGA